jgi:hypothetical protein
MLDDDNQRRDKVLKSGKSSSSSSTKEYCIVTVKDADDKGMDVSYRNEFLLRINGSIFRTQKRLVKNKWTFLALTLVPPSVGKSAVARLYLGGEMVWSETVQYPKFSSGIPHCFLGVSAKHMLEVPGRIQNCWQGRMGTVHIFGAAMTDKNVKAVFDAGPNFTFDFDEFQLATSQIEFAKLSEKLMLCYNPSVCFGKQFFDCTPYKTRLKFSVSSNEFFSRPSIGMQGTYGCVTRYIADTLACIGGVNIFLPLFAQIDQTPVPDRTLEAEDLKKVGDSSSPSQKMEDQARDYELQPEFCAQILQLITAVLESQKVDKAEGGGFDTTTFDVIGFLFGQLQPRNITTESTLAVKDLVALMCNTQLAKIACQSILMRYKLWVVRPLPVQREVMKIIKCISGKDFSHARIISDKEDLLENGNSTLTDEEDPAFSVGDVLDIFWLYLQSSGDDGVDREWHPREQRFVDMPKDAYDSMIALEKEWAEKERIRKERSTSSSTEFIQTSSDDLSLESPMSLSNVSHTTVLSESDRQHSPSTDSTTSTGSSLVASSTSGRNRTRSAEDKETLDKLEPEYVDKIKAIGKKTLDARKLWKSHLENTTDNGTEDERCRSSGRERPSADDMRLIRADLSEILFNMIASDIDKHLTEKEVRLIFGALMCSSPGEQREELLLLVLRVVQVSTQHAKHFLWHSHRFIEETVDELEHLQPSEGHPLLKYVNIFHPGTFAPEVCGGGLADTGNGINDEVHASPSHPADSASPSSMPVPPAQYGLQGSVPAQDRFGRGSFMEGGRAPRGSGHGRTVSGAAKVVSPKTDFRGGVVQAFLMLMTEIGVSINSKILCCSILGRLFHQVIEIQKDENCRSSGTPNRNGKPLAKTHSQYYLLRPDRPDSPNKTGSPMNNKLNIWNVFGLKTDGSPHIFPFLAELLSTHLQDCDNKNDSDWKFSLQCAKDVLLSNFSKLIDLVNRGKQAVAGDNGAAGDRFPPDPCTPPRSRGKTSTGLHKPVDCTFMQDHDANVSKILFPQAFPMMCTIVKNAPLVICKEGLNFMLDLILGREGQAMSTGSTGIPSGRRRGSCSDTEKMNMAHNCDVILKELCWQKYLGNVLEAVLLKANSATDVTESSGWKDCANLVIDFFCGLLSHDWKSSHNYSWDSSLPKFDSTSDWETSRDSRSSRISVGTVSPPSLVGSFRDRESSSSSSTFSMDKPGGHVRSSSRAKEGKLQQGSVQKVRASLACFFNLAKNECIDVTEIAVVLLERLIIQIKKEVRVIDIEEDSMELPIDSRGVWELTRVVDETMMNIWSMRRNKPSVQLAHKPLGDIFTQFQVVEVLWQMLHMYDLVFPSVGQQGGYYPVQGETPITVLRIMTTMILEGFRLVDVLSDSEGSEFAPGEMDEEYRVTVFHTLDCKVEYMCNQFRSLTENDKFSIDSRDDSFSMKERTPLDEKFNPVAFFEQTLVQLTMLFHTYGENAAAGTKEISPVKRDLLDRMLQNVARSITPLLNILEQGIEDGSLMGSNLGMSLMDMDDVDHWANIRSDVGNIDLSANITGDPARPERATSLLAPDKTFLGLVTSCVDTGAATETEKPFGELTRIVENKKLEEKWVATGDALSQNLKKQWGKVIDVYSRHQDTFFSKFLDMCVLPETRPKFRECMQDDLANTSISSSIAAEITRERSVSSHVMNSRMNTFILPLRMHEFWRRVEVLHHYDIEEPAEKKGLWYYVLRNVTSERGPWSDWGKLKPEQRAAHWKVSNTTDDMHRRVRMTRNYTPSTHICASDNEHDPAMDETVDPAMDEMMQLQRDLQQVKAMAIGTWLPNDNKGNDDDDRGSDDENDDDERVDVMNLADSPHVTSKKGGPLPPSRAAALAESSQANAVCLLSSDCQAIVPFSESDGVIEIYQDVVKFKSKHDDGDVMDTRGHDEFTTGFALSEGADESGNPREYVKIKPLGNRKWKMREIKDVWGRRYRLVKCAVEIFFTDHSSLFLNFFDKKKKREFLSKLRSTNNLSRDRIHDRDDFEEELKRSNLTQLWREGKISNFEYLQKINFYSGRTYNDLAQYPVFPWVLSEYATEELDLTDENSFRDLTKSIMCQHKEGSDNCVQRFEQSKEMAEAMAEMEGSMPMTAFHNGTHYSRSGAVIWYLMRMEPYTTLHVHLQDGKFDNPDRLFWSVEAAYKGSSTNASHAMELTPEWFYMPEFLGNRNRFKLGLKQDGTTVDDVVLPLWAKGSPAEFIRLHRDALESEYVSKNLHHWIDLTFGHKQRPPWLTGGSNESVTANNIYINTTYSDSVNMEYLVKQHNHLYKAVIKQIDSFGQCPEVLFSEPHVERCIPDRDFSFRLISETPHFNGLRDRKSEVIEVSEGA